MSVNMYEIVPTLVRTVDKIYDGAVAEPVLYAAIEDWIKDYAASHKPAELLTFIDDWVDEQENYCACCGRETTIILEDVGIGSFEFWGRKGNDSVLVPVSKCCGDTVFTDPALRVEAEYEPEEVY